MLSLVIRVVTPKPSILGGLGGPTNQPTKPTLCYHHTKPQCTKNTQPLCTSVYAYYAGALLVNQMIANQRIQTERVDQSKARCKLYWDLGSGGGGAKEPQKDPPPSFSHHSPPPTVSPIFLSPADCSHCQ